jgi:hypothetical protein
LIEFVKATMLGYKKSKGKNAPKSQEGKGSEAEKAGGRCGEGREGRSCSALTRRRRFREGGGTQAEGEAKS